VLSTHGWRCKEDEPGLRRAYRQNSRLSRIDPVRPPTIVKKFARRKPEAVAYLSRVSSNKARELSRDSRAIVRVDPIERRPQKWRLIGRVAARERKTAVIRLISNLDN